MPESELSSIPPGVVRLRDQHAAETRRVIMQAGRSLFSETGYAAASVRVLAKRAGVAVKTIYDTFGSKAGVLSGLPDLVDEEAGVLEIVALIDAATDPREILGLHARRRRLIRERCGDIIQIMRSAAEVEPEIKVGMAEGLRRRRFGLERTMQRLDAMGALKDGLTPVKAADIASALVSDEVCDMLVEQAGWSFDDYEAWLAATLATLLLEAT